MKITIETDVAPVMTVQPPAEASSAAGAVSAPLQAMNAGHAPSLSGAAIGSAPIAASILARAASLGAINAGPAPSLISAAPGSAPIAASISGGSPEASMLTSSAGAPPPHVYGSKGGCK